MDEIEKLRVLIPYWISHNTEHANEFLDWNMRVGEPMPEIQAAANALEQANQSLAAALEKLGGASESSIPGLD